MTIKIVVNARNGGFTLSPHAVLAMIETMPNLLESFPVKPEDVDLTRTTPMENPRFLQDWTGVVIDTEKNLGYHIADSAWSCQPDFQLSFRADPALVDIVERLGDAASGPYSRLRVITIEDEDITLDKLEIVEYGGYESIREKSRIWSAK